MIVGKTHFVRWNGETLVAGKPLPASWGESLVFVDIFWVDGVQNEPEHWEVLACGPSTYQLLEVQNPVLVVRAVRLISEAEVHREDAEKILELRREAYDGLGPQGQAELGKLVALLPEIGQAIAAEGVLPRVFTLTPTVTVCRTVDLPDFLALLALRRAQVEATREFEEDEEVEGDEGTIATEGTP